MQAKPHVSYVSYDIQRWFYQKPDGPVRCPVCSGNLSKAAIEPSHAMRNEIADPGYHLIYGSSSLFVCTTCHWWCLREHYEFIDTAACHKYGDDYLVISIAESSKGEPLRSIPFHPWLKAHDDPRLYDDVQGLSNELALLFNGGITWEQERAQWKISKG